MHSLVTRPHCHSVARSLGRARWIVHSHQSFDAWYSPSPPNLERCIGPVKVLLLEGKGRGLVATSDLKQGSLILSVPPLAFLEGPDGQRPDAELLIDNILLQKLHEKSPWLRDGLLYDGSDASLDATPDISAPQALEELPLPDPPATDAARVKKLLSAKKRGAAGFGAKVKAAVAGTRVEGASAETQGSSDLPGGVDRVTAKRIAKTVSLNCFGDAQSDRAIAASREQAVTSHIGLWPEMSFINHSCAPNAINYVVGNTIIIRAAQDVAAGQEITISYLGRPQLDHVETRIDKLEEDYGFSCECERCTSELIHGEKLGDAFESFYEEVAEELGPLFKKAKEEKDVNVMEFITTRLRALMNAFYSSMQKALLSPQVRLFFISSLYDAYELQMEAERMLIEWKGDDEGEGKEVIDRSLLNLLKAITEVSPGSDLQVILAAKLAKSVEEAEGRESRKAQMVKEMAVSAVRSRYGPIDSAELIDKMLDLNRKLYD